MVNWIELVELLMMDIFKFIDVVSFNVLNNINEGLYCFGKNGKVIFGIVKFIKVINGGKIYMFILWKNVKWSNGDKVIVKDFVYGW